MLVVSEISLAGPFDKRLKTEASERIVPVHQTLLGLGFMRYVEQRRRSDHLKLFPDIDPGSKGKRAVAFSKWFTQFLRASGAYRERTSFHSFRHNFRDEMRATRIDHDIAMILGGWTTGRNANSASEDYGKGHPVSTLHDAISRLKFAEIDLSHLAQPDEQPRG